MTDTFPTTPGTPDPGASDRTPDLSHPYPPRPRRSSDPGPTGPEPSDAGDPPRRAWARARTGGRIAATMTALAAVSGAVLTTQDVGPGATVLADLSAPHDTLDPNGSGPADPTDRTDPPGLVDARAAAGRARAAVTLRSAAAERSSAAERSARAERRARAAAASRAARERAANARVASGDPRSAARAMVAAGGWSSAQFRCLDALWAKESGWNPHARNPGSGAFGIPQALPGHKMSSAGADWATNPVTQIRWGLDYIRDRYGSPCSAWSHSRAVNWY